MNSPFEFEKIAEFLKHPLILIGFGLMMIFCYSQANLKIRNLTNLKSRARRDNCNFAFALWLLAGCLAHALRFQFAVL